MLRDYLKRAGLHLCCGTMSGNTVYVAGHGTNDAGVLLRDYKCCGSNTKHVDAVPLLLFSPTCNIRDCIANAGQHLQCDNNKYISFENI